MKSILLLGNPNSGKSLLFNRLTGLRQKVANFPGVTTELMSGAGRDFTFIDFPGIYSLQPITEDERVTVKGIETYMADRNLCGIIYVLDSTRLERSLLLLLQLRDALGGFPLVVAANVMDEVIGKREKIDLAGLARETGYAFMPLSAKKGEGLADLEKAVASFGDMPVRPAAFGPIRPDAGWYNDEARRLSGLYGPRADVILKSQNRLDHFFLSSFFGPVVFAALMVFLFQAIFSWAAPLMDLVEAAIGGFGEWSVSALQGSTLHKWLGQTFMSAHLGMLKDFYQDAIIGGIGSFLVFAPQIFILFLVIGCLEDSGYLSRAAIICHRPLGWFGLSGRSFVPLLSGHACAVPAIMAARTIASPRSRLLTIIAIPLMSCSARLPVYALLVGAFVPQITYLGLISSQTLVFTALYALGLVAGLLVSALCHACLGNKAGNAPFIVELPPYRLPDLKTILMNASLKTWSFISKAGSIIFAVVVGVWLLSYFPDGRIDSSIMSVLGRAIEPALLPLGLDWKIGVAILTSFLAREAFVGTLGTMYGIENAEDNMTPLAAEIQKNPHFTLATALALLVFYALAMQCVSTLAVMKKETGGYKVPVLVFFGFSLLAYTCSLLVYKIAS